MNFLVDFSTLRSVEKGLGSYGFYRYLQEAWGTEGLTQLLDIARLIDLVILSDEILVSQRIAQISMPIQVMERIRFIELNANPEYFSDLALFGSGSERLSNEISEVERLLGFKVVKDFVSEIDMELTETDYAFVQALANKIPDAITVPEADNNRQRSRVLAALIARTLQYLQTSDVGTAPYICHAYRSPIVRMLNPRLTSGSFDIYRECQHRIRSWLMESFGSERLEFQLPMFFLAVVKEAQSPADVFRIAEEFRDSKEAIRIRQLLSEVRDEHNQVNLKGYAELRRVSDEEMKRFQRQFSFFQGEEANSSLPVEISASPMSISVKASMDVLRLSRDLIRGLTEQSKRRGLAIVFNTARTVYQILSVEQDIHRLWGVGLTQRHRDLLRQISQNCDI